MHGDTAHPWNLNAAVTDILTITAVKHHTSAGPGRGWLSVAHTEAQLDPQATSSDKATVRRLRKETSSLKTFKLEISAANWFL